MRRTSSLNIRHLILLSVLAMATSSLLSGCETDSDRQIAAGHACLDSAKTSDDADTCVATVNGLSTPDAYLIRCSANFLAQGFTSTRLATAFQKIKDNSSSGTDPMAAMISYLVFAKSLSNHTVAIALSNCSASGVSSMYRLAVAANLATTIAELSGGITSSLNPDDPSFDASAMLTRLQSLYTTNSDSSNQQIGAIAITADSAYCNSSSAYKSSDICKDLDAALATSSDPATIGHSLLGTLQTTN